MARWFVDRLPQRGLPSVSLRRLLPEAQFAGCVDWKVFGCTDDHRRLEPGQVFVAAREARPGYDGHLFVREALERGAAGVVVERPCPEAGRLQVDRPECHGGPRADLPGSGRRPLAPACDHGSHRQLRKNDHGFDGALDHRRRRRSMRTCRLTRLLRWIHDPCTGCRFRSGNRGDGPGRRGERLDRGSQAARA